MIEIKLVGKEQAISAMLMIHEIWLIDKRKIFYSLHLKWNETYFCNHISHKNSN